MDKEGLEKIAKEIKDGLEWVAMAIILGNVLNGCMPG